MKCTVNLMEAKNLSLSKEELIKMINFKIDYQTNNPDKTSHSPACIECLMKKTEKKGGDVAEQRAKLPRIKANYAIAEIEEMIKNHLKNPGEISYSPYFMEELINKAKAVKEHASDIAEYEKKIKSYEARLPEFEVNYAVGELENAISVQEEYPDTPFYLVCMIEKLIETVRRLQIDVTIYEAKLPKLREAENRRKH